MKNIIKKVIGNRFTLLWATLSIYSISTNAQCITPNAPVNFSNTGNNTSTGYNTVYVLTDNAGNIIQSVNTGFAAPAAGGNYKVYAVNYRNNSGDVSPTLTPGTNIAAIGGTCVNTSGSPLSFCVTGSCYPPGSNVSFVANGQNNSSGYATRYVLTDSTGKILSLPASTTFTAPNDDGNYKVYVVNYNNNSGNTPPALTVGSNITTIGGTCVATSQQPMNFCVFTSSTLPVTLLSFSATKEGKTTELDWKTTNQVNTEKFDVQRSADSKNWTTIGTVAANEEQSNYAFTDVAPLQGWDYYRLKSIDKNAVAAYSAVRSLKFDAIGNGLTIYPNPVSHTFYLKNESGAAMDFSSIKEMIILNAGGALVYRTQTVTEAGINVPQLSNGVYLIKVIMNDGSVSSHKMVVVK